MSKIAEGSSLTVTSAADRPKTSSALFIRRLEKFLLYTVLMLLAMAFLAPFYWVVVSSVKETAELQKIPPTWWPHTFTLAHHARVWTPKFMRYFVNSFVYAGGTTLLAVFTSSLLGYVLVKYRSKFGDMLFVMLLATMMVPFATYVVPLHGLLIQMQETFHVKMVNTYQGMMLPFTVWPFGIFLMRQAMFSVPDELIDAAKIDGASTLGIFWRVVVPLVQSQTFALAIYSFIFRYDDLLWPLVVATNEKMYPVAVGLMEFIGFYFVEYGLMMAASTAAIVPVVVIYIFLQQYILQGIAITGLKG